MRIGPTAPTRSTLFGDCFAFLAAAPPPQCRSTARPASRFPGQATAGPATYCRICDKKVAPRQDRPQVVSDLLSPEKMHQSPSGGCPEAIAGGRACRPGARTRRLGHREFSRPQFKRPGLGSQKARASAAPQPRQERPCLVADTTKRGRSLPARRWGERPREPSLGRSDGSVEVLAGGVHRGRRCGGAARLVGEPTAEQRTAQAHPAAGTSAVSQK